jgi:hypothetical protein
MFKNLIVILILAVISACSNSTQKKIGLLKSGPDESVVEKKAHLNVPPILTQNSKITAAGLITPKS